MLGTDRVRCRNLKNLGVTLKSEFLMLRVWFQKNSGSSLSLSAALELDITAVNSFTAQSNFAVVRGPTKLGGTYYRSRSMYMPGEGVRERLLMEKSTRMFLPSNSVPLARSLACKQMVHIPRCQILHEKARAGLPSQPVSSPFLNRPTVLSLVESFSWFNTVLPFKSSKVDSHLMNHALHNCDLFFRAKSDMPTLSVYYSLQVLPICD